MTLNNPSENGLAKSIWTEADFEEMGWHDARVYGYSIFPEEFEFVLDLDYITKWVDPVSPDPHFTFWVSPVTLVFKDVQNVSISVEMDALRELEVLSIQRTSNGTDWRWVLELSCGEISFDSGGFTQFFRKSSAHQAAQEIAFNDRGGVSYERVSFDMNSRD